MDFVIWTGDSARHDSDEKIPRTKDQVLGTNKLLSHKFANTFVEKLKIPVVPTFGNNDMLPHNILLPGPNKWLGYYAKIWDKFIPEEQRHSFAHGGWFYVEVVPQKLAVFSLNTMYFFDRNAAVDDCIRHSEPGYEQMEWLKIHLDAFRERGMKAILMGHVPPARTDSKQNWDETCWQKYTLWLRQYRDVIVGAVYGHMNIDHFMFQDTQEIDFKRMTVDYARTHAAAKSRSATGGFGKEAVDISSASDYLHELRDNWSKLPNPIIQAVATTDNADLFVNGTVDEQYIEFEDTYSAESTKGHKKKKPHKKLSSKWAERYQLSMISPSIVPNYFPTLRIIEYNITGLEKQVTWADALERPELFSNAASLFNIEADKEEEKNNEEKEKTTNELDFDVWRKRSKKKGNKKGKKPDLNFEIPEPPAKTAPPGPAYSVQPFTWTGYTQYFANLTWINNDMTEDAVGNIGTERWREGIHKGKTPKSNKPKPRDFKFEVEYSTFDDKVYNLKDMTVRSMVHLAYRIGKQKKKDFKMKPGTAKSLDSIVFDSEDDFELDMELESEYDDKDNHDKEKTKADTIAERGKKHKKHKDYKTNKVWLAFLKRALVSTLPEKKLKKFEATYTDGDSTEVMYEI